MNAKELGLMTEFLVRKFIRDYDNVRDTHVREAYGRLGSIVGIILNAILCTGKIAVGTLTGSLSITADGINNLSDAGSSVITLVGFKMAGKPADKDHPFGHARIEYISGLIVAFIILLLGAELCKSSVSKILNPEEPVFSYAMILILAVSILVKMWLSRFNMKLADRISSAAMKATSADSLNDVISTSAVLASVIITKISGWNIDGFMGLAVAAFIIYSGVSILKDILNPLLGELPEGEFIMNIESKILSYDGILNIHDLVVHNYGPRRYFATVHAEVDASKDILRSHDLIDNIERDVASDMDINLVIHMDPVVTDDEETNNLRLMVQCILMSMDKDLSMHDFRIVKGPTHTNLIFDVVVPVDSKWDDKELARLIDQKVRAKDKTLFTVITVDKNYMSTHTSKLDLK